MVYREILDWAPINILGHIIKNILQERIVMQTNIKRQDGYVYHIDLKNKVFKGKIGAIPNHPKEYVCTLDFDRKSGYLYYLNEKCELIEQILEK